MKKLIVFTDLDGSLLRHEDYLWQEASPALQELAAHGCPVILNSSKTFSEMLEHSCQFKLQHPFALENGGAIAVPMGYFDNPQQCRAEYEIIYFGKAYPQIIKVLDQLRSEKGLSFEGFHDWDAEKVSALTNLNEIGALSAQARHCSEPILWHGSDSELERFRVLLHEHGLILTQGGRFYHVMSSVSKGTAVDWLIQQFREHQPNINWITVALGDSENDLPMLQVVDYPVLIPNPHRQPPVLPDNFTCIKATQAGPAGWNETMLQLIHDLL